MDNSFEHEYSATIKVPLGPGVSRENNGDATAAKLDVKKVAVRNKNILFGCVFVLCTASSVYCGVNAFLISSELRTSSGMPW